MYIYESHERGLYASENIRPTEKLYCQQCDDYDKIVGYAETAEEAWDLLKHAGLIGGKNGYSAKYANAFVTQFFPPKILFGPGLWKRGAGRL